MKKMTLKKLSIMVVLASFSLGTLSAQKSVEDAVQTLKQLMIHPDQAGFEKILDEKLSYGHSSGKVENRAEFIANLLNGNSDFVSMELSGQSIIRDRNISIVRHHLDAITNDKGIPGSVSLDIMLVWIKKGKQWKLLARQAVKKQNTK